MSSSSSSSTNGGIGFFGLLTIVFIVLKLTGYIDWSWFWVLSPLLAPVVIIFTVLFIILALGGGFRRTKKTAK